MQQQDEQRQPPPAAPNRRHQPPPRHSCQRCGSSNTKFCYYNNYSLSQPRYFCKSCRRYWTHGGSLRNVPVGGGRRRTRRPRPSTLNNEIARGLRSGQPLPPVIPPMGDYSGRAFLPGGTNQWPAVNFSGGGDFGSNVTLLQQMSGFPPLNSQAARAHFVPSHEGFIPARPWADQGLANTGGASGSGYRSGGGGLVGGASFSLASQRSDAHLGFNPSDQFSVISNFNVDMHGNKETSNF